MPSISSNTPDWSRAAGKVAGATFLRAATDRLSVKLEPIVDAGNGRLVACEALMSGTQQLGLDGAHAVLDCADRLGVLADLEIMLACRAIDAVVAHDGPRSSLFINLDGRTLPDWRRLRDRLVYHLQTRGMSAAEICIELSETRQVLTGPDLAAAVDGLRKAGLRIAIDDFGTGVSGLQMLYLTRPNFLKIDRFFIRDMPRDVHKRLMVHAITRLAHTLGARVIAEGIETHAELDACRRAECGLVQGFLLKAPDRPDLDVSQTYALPGNDRQDDHVDERLRRLIRPQKTFAPDTPLRTLFAHFETGDLSELVPIVDQGGALLGGVLWTRLRPILSSRYGPDLARNPSFRFSVTDLIEPVPVIELRQPLEAAIDLVADRARHGVIVLDRGRYEGYLSPFDLMQLANSIRLAEAQRLNPLSGLPGNHAINRILTDYAAHPDMPRLMAYIDISHFKPFNDRFGFDLGDRAILMLADALKQIADTTGAFIGHIGGDDFFVAARDGTIPAVHAELHALPERFMARAATLVPDEVRRAGVYTGKTRTGQVMDIPLIEITIAGMTLDPGMAMPAATDVASDLAEIKSRARAMKTAVLIVQGDGRDDTGQPDPL